ncbi:uncharacterized protein B4U80_06052, partial [Leptotrombidium deliense]
CYKRQRNLVVSLIRTAKSQYYNNLLVENKRHPKKFWRILKQLLPTKKSNNFRSNSDIDVNAINKQFIESANNCLGHYSTDETFAFGDLCPRTASELIEPEVTIEKVKCIIKTLKSTANGSDNISAFILKKLSDTNLEFIIKIIEYSFKHGIFPDMWKNVRVTPMPKVVSNEYRPISIISNVSKICERLVFESLNEHLKNIKFLSDQQFGFRRNYSTQCMLLCLQHAIKSQMDRQQFVTLVSLDLKKAFDTVNRQLLLDKLSCIGVHGSMFQWFNSYLTNRRQFIHLQDKMSSVELNNIGVPQGSILGPLLFEIFIMDIFKLNICGKLFAYADDMYLVVYGKSQTEMESSIILQKYQRKLEET